MVFRVNNDVELVNPQRRQAEKAPGIMAEVAYCEERATCARSDSKLSDSLLDRSKENVMLNFVCMQGG